MVESTPPPTIHTHTDDRDLTNKMSDQEQRPTMEELSDLFVAQLSDIERVGLEIARGMGSSFNLRRSNGFIAWMKARDEAEREGVQEATG